MATQQFDRIVKEGTSPGIGGRAGLPSNRVFCADGTDLSVIAHWGAYCTPRPEFQDPAPDGGFLAVEVGFPSVRPEPWHEWSVYCENTDDPTGTVYGRVPVEMVRAFIESHGGER
jgi:hypothetical protein